jgi:hypothetical protein
MSGTGLPGLLCTSDYETHWNEESKMARGKRYQPEQVVNLLRQIEVAVANGKTTSEACKEPSDHTPRWDTDLQHQRHG